MCSHFGYCRHDCLGQRWKNHYKSTFAVHVTERRLWAVVTPTLGTEQNGLLALVIRHAGRIRTHCTPGWNDLEAQVCPQTVKQQLPAFLGSRKFNIPPPDPILSHIHRNHRVLPYLGTMHFNIILRPKRGMLSGFFPSGHPIKILYYSLPP